MYKIAKAFFLIIILISQVVISIAAWERNKNTHRQIEFYSAIDKLDKIETSCKAMRPLTDFDNQLRCLHESEKSWHDLHEWIEIKDRPPICKYPIHGLKIAC